MKRIALIGTGRIGTHHARTLAREVAGIELAVLADPASPTLERLAADLAVPAATRDPLSVAADDSIDAVVIASPTATHVELIEAFAAAGKDIFTEKPIALTVADAKRAIAATDAAGVVLQVGFNRRFAESWTRAEQLVAEGAVGRVQRLHSITRDPGPYGADPARVPAGTIFTETLIHDFDILNWFNAGSEPVDVYAVADALVRPDAKDTGFQDSAVVVIRYANGALATAEASFSAMYGYDLRGEVFGSAGMVQMGQLAATAARLYDAAGGHTGTAGTDTSRFHEAYRTEFQTFADVLHGADTDYPEGTDGLRAQLVATAAIRSAAEGRPVRIAEVDQ
ncbi:Gfo/Idh/MocA family oxidoreductase [Raineyella sp. W15-4]|uniref:Gfo/Idh/MocA family oxidoreductase n=1 Tax=Raineyella sp. W15-4 TaxID=3081651 RepID=UPI0029542A47|nr:Gfo/Idh/MocA family oxidoreductase [Raineyella sp. W15-4]WOQ18574.1 Gfo/Idh/MocA family oxidoreductase [Raineyella sp. W15-4]